MRNCLSILLITDNIEAVIFHSYHYADRVKYELLLCFVRDHDAPLVKAFATFETVFPTAPAISSGRSERCE